MEIVSGHCFFSLSAFISLEQNDHVNWNYNISHGLPTNSIYHGFVDSKNRVWFGSDKVVTCFNGTNFKTYNVDDGLAENTVIRCYEDSRGRIWFQHLNKLPSHYKNGKITLLKTKNKTTVIEPLSNLVELQNGDLVIGGTRDIVVIKSNDVVEYKENKTAIRYVTLYQENNILHFTSFVRDQKEYKRLNSRGIRYKFDGLSHSDFTAKYQYALEVSAMFRSVDFLKSYMKKSYFRPLNFLDIYPITGKTYIIVEHEGFVFIASEKGLFKFRIEGGNLVYADVLISNTTIVSVSFDQSDNIWATSIENGLFFLSNLKHSFTPFPKNKRLLRIKKFEDKILLCGQSISIYSFKNGVFSEYVFWDSKNGDVREITDFYNW